MLSFCYYTNAQVILPDTVRQSIVLADSLSIDLSNQSDTSGVSKTQNTGSIKKKSDLEAKVTYKAMDSLRFSVRSKKVFLFNESEVNYQKTNLTAGFIQMDFATNNVFARGTKDSLGVESGTPEFKDGDQSFKARTINYNFKTRKGLIQRVKTQDGEGFLHGERVKKMPDESINLQAGGYTTCNLDHPHFAFRFNKAKVIPDNKIVTGPTYLTIEDVPTILFLPFGLFPNKKNQKSGIIIPTYGESASRGFYLENGGYYWAINDYLDLQVTGDIYTRGSWSIEPTMRYANRYKYNGSFALALARNITGEEGDPGYSNRRDFSVRWNHSQDPKARPNSSFSANVNIVSSKFNQYNPASFEDYLSSTFQSGVAYQTNFNGKYFLSINSNYTQNTRDNSVSLTLPQVSLTANRFTPFRRKETVGQLRWYENITVNYSMNAENRINTYDTLLFTKQSLKDMNYGIRHAIPISSTIKVLKYFNLTNSINYNERWYFQSIRKNWTNDTLITATDTIAGYVHTDTLYGFNAARDFSFSSSLNTRIYGMYNLRIGPILAIRHVVNPSISFSYNPDFSSDFWGYYKPYQKDAAGTMADYSIFEGLIYGSPTKGRSGRLGFSISNNLEMKVRNRNDTITGSKKIVLIENLSLSTSYDFARDSLRWSKVMLSGRTTLFNNLNITYASTWDPYILDSTGKRNLNKFEWDVNRRLLRHDNTSWYFAMNWDWKSTTKKKNTNPSPLADDPEYMHSLANPDNYVDFNVPWNLGVSYNLRYTALHNYQGYVHDVERKLLQTIQVRGGFSLTPKWKFTFNSGYDMESKKVSLTNISIYRDLHCWEMRFNWVPLGGLKSWNFQINVKSSVLQDLKLTKKKDWRDN